MTSSVTWPGSVAECGKTPRIWLRFGSCYGSFMLDPMPASICGVTYQRTPNSENCWLPAEDECLASLVNEED